MYYSYILKSKSFSEKYYYGYTTNISRRLEMHNNGMSKYTSKYLPWKLIFYAGFEHKHLAQAFEIYLKTASGRAFMRKRLIDKQEIIV